MKHDSLFGPQFQVPDLEEKDVNRLCFADNKSNHELPLSPCFQNILEDDRNPGIGYDLNDQINKSQDEVDDMNE